MSSTTIDVEFAKALALHQHGQLAEAERIYRRILTAEPRHFDSTHLLGVIFRQRREFEAAEHQIGRAIQIDPTIASAHSNRGLVLHDLDRPEDAIESYDRAIALKPDYPEAFNNRGNALQDLNRFEDALANYDKALAIRPRYPEAFNNRGNALEDLGRHEEAIASYDKAIALKPDYASAFNNRALALQGIGRFDDALASYHKAISLKPDYAEAFNNRGTLLDALKRFNESLADCDRAIVLKPDYAVAFNNRGNALHNLKRFGEAVVSYSRAIALKPDYVLPLNNRALSLHNLKRFEDALASCNRAIALQPDYADAYNTRGIALHDLRRFREALDSYEKAIELRGGYAAAYNNRGNALTELKRFDEAIVNFDQALAIRPDYPEAHNGLGVALQAVDRYEDALTHFTKAISLKPDYDEAFVNRGIALQECGRAEEARADFERAFALAPQKTRPCWALSQSKKIAASDPCLAALEELAGGPQALSEDEQVLLHFALGKAYADSGRHELGFSHLLLGNAMNRRRNEYDEPATMALMERIGSSISSELLSANRIGGDPSALPIFIVGMPRSGSTLVEQILASHPQVSAGGERFDFNAAINSVGTDFTASSFPDDVRNLSRGQLRLLGSNYVARLVRAASVTSGAAPTRITDKLLVNFRVIGLIHMALPNARILHTVRDPVDTCLSCFSTLFDPRFSNDLGELGRYYSAYARLMNHWRALLPPGVMLDVQYEEVVDDLEQQARRIVAHCGLPWDDACLNFHQAAHPVKTASVNQVRKPIYRDSVGRWRPSDEVLRPLYLGLAR